MDAGNGVQPLTKEESYFNITQIYCHYFCKCQNTQQKSTSLFVFDNIAYNDQCTPTIP